MWNHSWLSAGYEVAFGSFNDGAAFVDSLAICSGLFGGFFRLTLQTHFFKLAVGNRHHGFVESIDGRIVLPVKRAIKLQLLFIERTEFLYGYVLDFDTRFRLGGILSLFRLTAGFADRLQFAEEIVGKQARVGIIGVIRTAVGLYILGWFHF